MRVVLTGRQTAWMGIRQPARGAVTQWILLFCMSERSACHIILSRAVHSREPGPDDKRAILGNNQINRARHRSA
jgi:hypothetical protein